ncbi:MAG: hypothetical protein J6B90_01210 [Lachnospiraceae bacterium]|nr:hypothetical protein [Lachnospiraceae bacterium]
MHISFQNTPSSNVDKVTTTYQSPSNATTKAGGGYAWDISGTVTDNAAYGFQKSRGVQGRTAEEVMQAAGGSEDITLYRNYMTVMSNCMSDEDFARMQEEGYDISDIDMETAVTIVDTIKAELMKAGVNIVGYTDTVDMQQLAEITGSEAFARQLSQAFAAEDIPTTQENAEQALEAFYRAQELTALSEGSMKYMVTNEIAPQIDNLYLAQHAGAADANRQANGYFAEEMPGYYAQKASVENTEGLQAQIEKIIEKAGFLVTDETVADGFWLVEKGVPLTSENFARMQTLKEVQLPAKAEDILEAIAGAIAEGKPAGEADLANPKSIYRRAVDCYISYQEKYRETFSVAETPENITARRQLEEIRLRMTVEANVKLLKSGFSIDTAPIEEAIEALKALEEKQLGAKADGHSAITDSSIAMAAPADLCRETLSKTNEIPYLPAASLGRILSLGETFTVDNIYETGKALQEAYRQAGEAYETMWTAPRADMGDSIKKAFRNVDTLLESMGMELTDENRKAVRSLSYNQMELTEENMLAVKGADKVVQRVVEKMTPSAVLDMIRKGINPLKTSMEELDTFLSQRDNYAEDSEKYSRFLYNLEQNKEITVEEKNSYIGIYRLLHQIEKSDGAVIGKLVDTQAEINFANLLSAVRTGKVKGVNVSVDETFGGLKEAVEKGVSIDVQIEAAYNKQKVAEVRGTAKTDEEAFRMLKQLEQPVTMSNLMAADYIKKDGARSFKKMAEYAESGVYTEEVESFFADSIFSIGDAEQESVKQTTAEEIFANRENLQEAYDAMISKGEALVKEMTFAPEAVSLDVRTMQLVCKQLHLQGIRAAREEEYDLPQMIDGELTAVHLKLVHDSAESGRIQVRVQTEKYGALTGEFSMKESVVSGYFTGEGEEALQMLETAGENFAGRVQNAGLEAGSLQIIQSSSTASLAEAGGNKEETKELYRVAGMAISAFKTALSQTA